MLSSRITKIITAHNLSKLGGRIVFSQNPLLYRWAIVINSGSGTGAHCDLYG